MLILAIDSAGAGCSIGLWRDGVLMAMSHEVMDRGQDRRLIPMIEQVLLEQEVRYADLDRIAVTTGPGSFTGLRIGIAAACGLGLALQKTVVGLDRFSLYEALAYNNPLQKDAIVILESRRTELYVRVTNKHSLVRDAAMLTDAQIAEVLALHSDAQIVGDTSHAEVSFSADLLMEMLAQKAASADLGDPSILPRPFYIRSPDVTVKPDVAQIQPVTSSDAAELAALHALTFPHAPWTLDQMQGSLALPTTRGWLVRHAGHVASFILCQVVGYEWEILTLATHPALQRKGFARLLLKQIEDAFRCAKGQKCFLDVSDHNIAAQRLYEAAGFSLFGRRKDYYSAGQERMDAFLYETNFGNENNK